MSIPSRCTGPCAMLNPSPYLFYLETREGVHLRLVAGDARALPGPRGRDAADRGHRPARRDAGRGRAPRRRRSSRTRRSAPSTSCSSTSRATTSGASRRSAACAFPVRGGREVLARPAPRLGGPRARSRRAERPLDALAACFPAGTLTGAPKIRAMELIDALEAARRGVYGGAVGYLDAAGNLDLAIAIRTAVVENGLCRVQAGAGHRRGLASPRRNTPRRNPRPRRIFRPSTRRERSWARCRHDLLRRQLRFLHLQPRAGGRHSSIPTSSSLRNDRFDPAEVAARCGRARS